jgi:hypothetical protein
MQHVNLEIILKVIPIILAQRLHMSMKAIGESLAPIEFPMVLGFPCQYEFLLSILEQSPLGSTMACRC